MAQRTHMKKRIKNMTDKEEKLARDALKYGMIFMLALTAPLWAPMLIVGAFVCFPLYLIYLLFDEFEQDRIEKEVRRTAMKNLEERYCAAVLEAEMEKHGLTEADKRQLTFYMHCPNFTYEHGLPFDEIVAKLKQEINKRGGIVSQAYHERIVSEKPGFMHNIYDMVVVEYVAKNLNLFMDNSRFSMLSFSPNEISRLTDVKLYDWSGEPFSPLQEIHEKYCKELHRKETSQSTISSNEQTLLSSCAYMTA